jgi:hypothetical protein
MRVASAANAMGPGRASRHPEVVSGVETITVADG